jgi:hypothetical protein
MRSIADIALIEFHNYKESIQLAFYQADLFDLYFRLRQHKILLYFP